MRDDSEEFQRGKKDNQHRVMVAVDEEVLEELEERLELPNTDRSRLVNELLHFYLEVHPAIEDYSGETFDEQVDFLLNSFTDSVFDQISKNRKEGSKDTSAAGQAGNGA